MNDIAIKPDLIYESQSDSEFITIVDSCTELKRFSIKEQSLLIAPVQDWRKDFCTYSTSDLKVDTENDFGCLSKSNQKLKLIADSEDEFQLLCMDGRMVFAQSISKSLAKLQIKKSWTFRVEAIKIVYAVDDLVLYIDASGLFRASDWAHQYTAHTISEDVFRDIIVLNNSGNGRLVLVAELLDRVELLEIRDFKTIVAKKVLHEGTLAGPIEMRDSKIFMKTPEAWKCFEYNAASEFNSIFESCRTFSNEFDAIDCGSACYGYSHRDGSIIFSDIDSGKQLVIPVNDSSFASKLCTFGSLTFVSGNQKSVFGSSLNVLQQTGHLVHICRNSYGDILDIKYALINGAHYFLCLHTNALLVCSLKITKSGCIEPFLLKAISLPLGEFSNSKCNIMISGDDKIFIRNDCNAYEFDLEKELCPRDWAPHVLDNVFNIKMSILTVLQGQTIDSVNLDAIVPPSSESKEAAAFRSALEATVSYQQSMDQFGFNAGLLLTLRAKLQEYQLPVSILSDVLAYEIVAAARCDSQALLINHCVSLCQEKLSLNWFEFFQFGFWVKNMESLVRIFVFHPSLTF